MPNCRPHFLMENHMPFNVTTTGRDQIGLRQALEDFANEQWIPDFLDDDQRVAWVLDQFERTLTGELKLLELEVA